MSTTSSTPANYIDFLEEKVNFDHANGYQVALDDIHPMLKDHQRAIVQWAVAGGRRAIFAAFGLGKTFMQLETVRLTIGHTGGSGLIVLPLGVRQEFTRDAATLGIPVTFIRTAEQMAGPGIYITNYESIRDGKLDPNLFNAASLDEASVLRSYGSKTFQTFLTLFDQVKHRFVATATPSPNRYKELIHYAGFLGVMDTGQALAQPVDANVLTPTGWRLMGDLAVGDDVISVDGTPTPVLGVYPQGEKSIYRITFSDGATTECTGEHLWLTRTQYERNNARRFALRNPDDDDSQYWTVRDTTSIAATLRCESTGSTNHQVPLIQQPVEFQPRPVAVDPWLMGVLIGDGCLRDTSISLTSADDWIIQHAHELVVPLGLAVRKVPHVRADGQPNYDYLITGGKAGRGGRGHHTNAVLAGMRSYDLLGKRAWEKRIPADYLLNDAKVRLAVLQGLMDADGTIAADPQNRTTHLCTTSAGLVEDVTFIVRSLGGTATTAVREGRTPTGGRGRDKYIVTMRLPNGTNPFALPRKADLVIERLKYEPVRYITTIEPVGVKFAQCIAVAHPERLYVTDDLVVTHNTRFFQRDSTQANNLTLYPHKEREFWLWLSTWAIFLQKPSDLGYDDTGYDLPELEVVFHEVAVDHSDARPDRDGQVALFRGGNLGVSDAAREKRDTLTERVGVAARLVAEAPADHFILWHDLEDERRAIKHAIPEAVEVFGQLDLDIREQRVIDFSDGKIRLLATKPELSGSGCNFQRHCHRAIFVGVGFKFNDFIQALHRIHRFLQTEHVRIDIIHAESEREVVRTLQRKWDQHKELTATMSNVIRQHGLNQVSVHDALTRSIGVERIEASGQGWLVANNDCVDETRSMADNSVDLIVTSIPFSNHYEYTPSYNDFGHTDDNDHFWAQMDFLTPELLRVLRPGRVYACHVKDRILFGNTTGAGVPTSSPFHAEALMHGRRHGFDYLGMITVVTDVVRENNQTYRLGWSEQCKDGTKMGVGSPEYILLFHKPQTDRTRGYADVPVVKSKAEYTRARWQVDAHAFWRSSGDRNLTPDELAALPADQMSRLFTEQTLRQVYDYESHIKVGEALEAKGALPATFMAIAPGSHHSEVWTDVNRMLTLNTEQSRRAQTMHVCPLQFDIVDRLIGRYSNPGELVYDPFGGLFTVPVRALHAGRQGRAVELNPGYFLDGVKYLQAKEREVDMPGLFELLGDEAEVPA